MRLSVKSFTGVADPRGMKRDISCSRQKVQQISGCPILRAFCEGWDTTNLDNDRRLSHPLQRAQRMGYPPFCGASCRAKHQPRLNRERVSSQSSTGVEDPRDMKRVLQGTCVRQRLTSPYCANCLTSIKNPFSFFMRGPVTFTVFGGLGLCISFVNCQ